MYGGQIIAQFRWEKGNWEGLLVYELLHSFSIYVDGEADRANWRLNSCGPGQSQQYELPPPSLFPHFLPLTRPQQRRKHIFSQAASNWYCWALGTQSVVLALWKNACKHHRLFTTTRPVWSRTSYSLSELKKGGEENCTTLGCGLCQAFHQIASLGEGKSWIQSRAVILALGGCTLNSCVRYETPYKIKK